MDCRVALDYGTRELLLYGERKNCEQAEKVLRHAIELATRGYQECCFEIALSGFCRATLGAGGCVCEVLPGQEEFVTLTFSGPAGTKPPCCPLSIPALVDTWSTEWFRWSMPIIVRDGAPGDKWAAHVTFVDSKDAKLFLSEYRSKDAAHRPSVRLEPYIEQAPLAPPINTAVPTSTITVRVFWGRGSGEDSRVDARNPLSSAVRDTPQKDASACAQQIANALPKEAAVLMNMLDTDGKMILMTIGTPNSTVAEYTLHVLHNIRGAPFHYWDMYISSSYAAEVPLDPLIGAPLQRNLCLRVGRISNSHVRCNALRANGRRILSVRCTDPAAMKRAMTLLRTNTVVHPLRVCEGENSVENANRARAVAFQLRKAVSSFNRGATSQIRWDQLQFRESDETLCFIGDEDTKNKLQAFLNSSTDLDSIACCRVVVRSGRRFTSNSRVWLDDMVQRCRKRGLPIRIIRQLNTVILIAPRFAVDAMCSDKKATLSWQAINGVAVAHDDELKNSGTAEEALLGVPRRAPSDNDESGENDTCPLCLNHLSDDRIHLSCGHWYCVDCLQNMFNGGAVPRLPIVCVSEGCGKPVCAAELPLFAPVVSVAALGFRARDDCLKKAAAGLQKCKNNICNGVSKIVSGSNRICTGCDLKHCEECEKMGQLRPWHDGRPHCTLADVDAQFIADRLPLLPECPTCQGKFYDFDACFAVTCTQGHNFCGFCMQACDTNRAAHAHVSSCARNPNPLNYFSKDQTFFKCRSEDLAVAMKAAVRAVPGFSESLVNTLFDLVTRERMSEEWPTGPINEAKEELLQELSSPPHQGSAPVRRAVPAAAPSMTVTVTPADRTSIARAKEALSQLTPRLPRLPTTSDDRTHALRAACQVCHINWDLFLASMRDVSEGVAAVRLYASGENARTIEIALLDATMSEDVAAFISEFYAVVLDQLRKLCTKKPLTAFRCVPWTPSLDRALKRGEALYWAFPAVCSTRAGDLSHRDLLQIKCTAYALIEDTDGVQRVVLPAGARLCVTRPRTGGIRLCQESDVGLQEDTK